AIDIAPSRPRRTMVFVHGLGGSASQWRYQLQNFSDDSRVLAIDLRGHGQSDGPHTAYDMPSIQVDLAAALKVLGVTEKFVLVGHSFGGAIAMEYAAAHPERVERLVLIAASGEYRLPGRLALALSLPQWMLNLAFLAYAHRFISTAPHALKNMYHNALATWNGWSLMRSLTTPTLVIRGSRDKVLAAKAFEDVVRAIPNAEEVDVGASAHMVMLERREAVNRAIERFVAG